MEQLTERIARHSRAAAAEGGIVWWCVVHGECAECGADSEYELSECMQWHAKLAWRHAQAAERLNDLQIAGARTQELARRSIVLAMLFNIEGSL